MAADEHILGFTDISDVELIATYTAGLHASPFQG